MTRVKPGQRKRTKAPKVKTGCRTCKLRRVKCDEARPACLRCLSTGRTCDGYDAESVETTPAPKLGLIGVGRSTISAPLTILDLNPSELRSLQFFAEKTVKQMSTFYPDELWNTVVLRLAQTEPSILHGLVALSAYHERFVCSEPTVDNDAGSAFALRHYNMAIRSRLDALQGAPSFEKEFIACLLFICIEILRGKHGAAIQLFMIGHGMIQDYRNQQANAGQSRPSASERDEILALVEPAFVRIAVQTSQLVGDIDPRLSVAAIPAFDVPTKPVDTPFKTLGEARESLVTLAVKCLRAHTSEAISANDALLGQWSRSFDVYLLSQMGSPQSAADKKGAALLKLQHRFLALKNELDNLKMAPELSLGDDDKNLGAFREMIHYAAIALGLDETDSGTGEISTTLTQEPRFHMDVGAIPILFAIGTRCRNPSIRRDVIRLMRDSGIQDGMWNSDLAARVAQRIVTLEEMEIRESGHVSEHIPAEARVRQVLALFDEEKRSATLKYERKYSQWEEIITW